MEQYVDVYEGLADREYVILAPDKAARWIRDLFERNGWEGDPDEVEPTCQLELLEEDDDGTGLYGADWYHIHTDHGVRYRQYIWLRPCGGGEYEAASRWMDDDPRVEEAVDAIEDAGSLDALCEALNAELDPAVEEQVYDKVDMTSLPTFGGNEPDDTLGVWSWDETRLLVGDSQPFEIVPRRTHDEDDEE